MPDTRESEMLTRLQERRAELQRDLEAIPRRAMEEQREMTSEEDRVFTDVLEDLETIDGRLRQLNASIEGREATEATMARINGHRFTPAVVKAEQDSLRSLILERNPRPLDFHTTDERRIYNPGVEQRDITTSTATLRPTNVASRIREMLVDSSSVLKAGATVIDTPDGSPLVLPKETAQSTVGIVSEGGAIPESDPTLSTLTLGSYKYALLVQLSYEVVTDSGIDLVSYAGNQIARAMSNTFGNHWINGTGSGQPRGVLLDTTAGVTGPTGTTTTFGTQSTAGMGTDLWGSLYASVNDVYATRPSAAFLAKLSTITNLRNLKTSQGDIVGNQYLAAPPAPILPDPNVPTQAANAKSIVFGAWDAYYVRFSGPLRVELSQDYAFANDLLSIRVVQRMDAGTLDVSGALKHYACSAT